MRDYETPEDVGVREFSSFVYRYSMTIELDYKPRVREIRNVGNEGAGSSESSRTRKGISKYNRPQITAGRESLAEVNVYDNAGGD